MTNSKALLLPLLLIAICAATSSSLATTIPPFAKGGLGGLFSGAGLFVRAQEPTNTEVVLSSEIEWEQLNPKRGDASPRAATLWGDRNGTEATGFLVKFVDGFSSPPHIHNVTYRGVVIGGGVHNDDPDATPMWMPPGSFWTQPAGEVHITAARGVSIAYIEIDKGPYLVLPVEETFDEGERPVNVDASNIVWLDASSTSWIRESATAMNGRESRVAFLWGDPQEGRAYGSLVKLPGGFKGKIHRYGSSFRAVVIEGELGLHMQNEAAGKALTPGSYFSSQGDTAHQFTCEANEDCIIYVRSEGRFELVQD